MQLSRDAEELERMSDPLLQVWIWVRLSSGNRERLISQLGIVIQVDLQSLLISVHFPKIFLQSSHICQRFDFLVH